MYLTLEQINEINCVDINHDSITDIPNLEKFLGKTCSFVEFDTMEWSALYFINLKGTSPINGYYLDIENDWCQIPNMVSFDDLYSSDGILYFGILHVDIRNFKVTKYHCDVLTNATNSLTDEERKNIFGFLDNKEDNE